MATRFDVDTLVADCVAASDEAEPRRAIRDVLTRTVAAPRAVADALRPSAATIEFLYRSDTLTVTNIVWAPGFRLFPHDHRMWAAIAIYTGREDNEFFRRSTHGPRELVDSGAKRLETGDVTLLGDDTIHAVANPDGAPTGAIHVYGGDFVAQPRSQWLPPDLVEEPFDFDGLTALFDEANRDER